MPELAEKPARAKGVKANLSKFLIASGRRSSNNAIFQRGPIRIAPSKRITSPFNIAFSTM